jgi:hypothetical protein
MVEKSLIPEIAKDELIRRAFRIKALSTDEKGKLHFIKPCDLETTAFTWDPVRMEPAEGLKELVTITTYHNYGAPSLFKPDIREVLSQIPAEFVERVSAFETDIDEAQQFSEEGSYHRAKTRLFGGPLPASVARYPVVIGGKALYPPAEDAAEDPKGIKVMRPIRLKPPQQG